MTNKSTQTTKKLTLDDLYKMMDDCSRLDGYGNCKPDDKKLVKKINEFFGVKKCQKNQ